MQKKKGLASLILLTAFAIAMIVFILLFVALILNYRDAKAGRPDGGIIGIGLSFPADEINDATIRYAASQGVSITSASADFLKWREALLKLYSLGSDGYYHYVPAEPFNSLLAWIYGGSAVLSLGGFIGFYILHRKQRELELL